MPRRPLVIAGKPPKPFSQMTREEIEAWVREQYRHAKEKDQGGS